MFFLICWGEKRREEREKDWKETEYRNGVAVPIISDGRSTGRVGRVRPRSIENDDRRRPADYRQLVSCRGDPHHQGGLPRRPARVFAQKHHRKRGRFHRYVPPSLPRPLFACPVPVLTKSVQPSKCIRATTRSCTWIRIRRASPMTWPATSPANHGGPTSFTSKVPEMSAPPPPLHDAPQPMGWADSKQTNSSLADTTSWSTRPIPSGSTARRPTRA